MDYWVDIAQYVKNEDETATCDQPRVLSYSNRNSQERREVYERNNENSHHFHY